MSQNFPAFFSRLAGDFYPSRFRQNRGSRISAYHSALPPPLDGARVFIFRHLILDLSRRDVANQLGERDRIAGAFESFRYHAATDRR